MISNEALKQKLLNESRETLVQILFRLVHSAEDFAEDPEEARNYLRLVPHASEEDLVSAILQVRAAYFRQEG